MYPRNFVWTLEKRVPKFDVVGDTSSYEEEGHD